MVKPTIPATQILRPNSKPSWQIPKMDGPGPGSYDVPKAIKESQWALVKGPIKSTQAKTCFTERHSKVYKYIPGSGHYKNLDNHDKVLNRDKQITRTHI